MPRLKSLIPKSPFSGAYPPPTPVFKGKNISLSRPWLLAVRVIQIEDDDTSESAAVRTALDTEMLIRHGEGWKRRIDEIAAAKGVNAA